MSKERKIRLILAVALLLLLSVGNVFLTAAMDAFFSGNNRAPVFAGFSASVQVLQSSNNARTLFTLLEFVVLALAVALVIINPTPYKANRIKITPDIAIPAPAGQGQHGTARFMPEKDMDRLFDKLSYSKADLNPLMEYGRKQGKSEAEVGKKIIEQLNDSRLNKHISEGLNGEVVDAVEKMRIEKPPPPPENFHTRQDGVFEKAGLVIDKANTATGESLRVIAADTHSLIIGMTRSGKTRCLVLETAVALALAGESMIFSDPKGELWAYLAPFLKRCGYNVICLDFKNPLRSDRYNFLQPIIDYYEEGKTEKAEEAVNDLADILTPDAKQTEPIWTNGERSVIAGAVLGIVTESKKREYQNMTNVYHFIAEMCETKEVKGKEQDPQINKWLETLPSGHPARTAFGAAKIAPGKTRGSFYTSALATLKLFSGASIYSMTSQSDYDPKALGVDKTALFVILPDDRSTYYRLASIIVKQHYQKLVEQADERGGRLKRRVNFILDEFGNFAKIPDFTNMLTVGGGRGIRFNLFLQDFAQLDSKYDKDEAKTIRSNCETWVYLKSNDTETNKSISERLGKYTTTVYSLSNSTARYSAPSSGTSVQLTGRELLLADEVARIKRPEALVITAGNDPVVTQLPDISKWLCNDMLGLGNQKHNAEVIAARSVSRPARDPVKPTLWGIWNHSMDEEDLFAQVQDELMHDQASQGIHDFNSLLDEAEIGYYTQVEEPPFPHNNAS